MAKQHDNDPWNSLAVGELEYRQKVDRRNSRTVLYKDAPKNGNVITGANGKSIKSVKFSANDVASEMETLTDSTSHKKLSSRNRPSSDYTTTTTTTTTHGKANLPMSSIFSPTSEGYKMKTELTEIGVNENLQPEQLRKIQHLLQIDVAKRTGFSEPCTESLVQDLYKKSQGIQYCEERPEETRVGSVVTQLFSDNADKKEAIYSENGNSQTFSKLRVQGKYDKTTDQKTKIGVKEEKEQEEKSEKPTIKKQKLEGGFGLIKFHSSKSVLKNNTSFPGSTVITPSKLNVFGDVSINSDNGFVHGSLNSTNKNNNDYDSNDKRQNHKIGAISVLSSFGKCLVNSVEFMECTFGVTFCDCKCHGCEFIHTDTDGKLVKGTECYYKSDESKVEYCKYDPRWKTSEFESREIYDNFLEPISLFEESLEQHYHRKASTSKHGANSGSYKISLLFAMEMLDSNRQIIPIAVSIFFTSNLDGIEIQGVNETKNTETFSGQNVFKPDTFCWSTNMDILFGKTDSVIKNRFSAEDVTKILNQIKSVDSVNRRVCCNKFNRSDAELFEFLSCKNSGFMDASSGSIKLCDHEKDKNVIENILKIQPLSYSSSSSSSSNKSSKHKTSSTVRCKTTVDGVTYEYKKSYLVAIIDSKIPSNMNVMVRSCFVLAGLTDGSERDKEKLVQTICNFNSSYTSKTGYYNGGFRNNNNNNNNTDSGYDYDAFGNPIYHNSSSSLSSSSTTKSGSVANQDTMTEEACFRPVMYSVDKLDNGNSMTMHALMWNEIKMYSIWKYVRSYVIVCPRSSTLENE